MTSWHVVGISREAFFSTAAYIPQGFADRLLGHPGMRTSVVLALAKTDAASMYSVKAALEKNLAQEGIQAAGNRSQADLRSAVDQHILMIYVFLAVMSGIVAAVGGLGLATTMSLNVTERRRELGVLRVIGASPSMIMRIIATEAAVIGVMSWILAALAAGPLSRMAGNSVMALLFKSKMDFVFAVQGLWMWLGVAVLLSVGASLLPARSAARLTVRESLAYE
jgi:putative ABC transport system permease protein